VAAPSSTAAPEGGGVAMNPAHARREINKRLTLNWLIQGAAQHAGMTAHHLVRDELDALHPDLVRLYDLYALSNLFQYWIPEAVLLLGLPARFWKRATSSSSHPFYHHPLLSQHGGALAATAKQRAVERAREKGVTGRPSSIPRRLRPELARLPELEGPLHIELIELAKQATSTVWGIPEDRLDTDLSPAVTLDGVIGGDKLRGRILSMTATGVARVTARDGAVDVVARATNWYFLAKELVKGTAELICLHGLAGLTDDVYQHVIDNSDRIEYEPWMLQTGGELWRRLLGVVPAGMPLQSLLMRLALSPADSRERVMRAVIEEPARAREDVTRMAVT
jgi:hypothetical protein